MTLPLLADARYLGIDYEVVIWYCDDDGAEIIGDPNLAVVAGGTYCLKCALDRCTCGATLKVEHALVACATREEPADYEERLLCHECGYEEKL